MRIALDARWIYKQLSGIGLYTQELITHLAQADHQNRYIILFQNDDVRERTAALTRFNWAANFDYCMLSNGPFSPWNQMEMPIMLKKLRIDVYHSMNYMIPFFAFPRRHPGRVRCVTTIHDLIPLLHPEFTPRAKKTRLYPLFKTVMRETALRTDLLIVPSQSSRSDMAKTFPDMERLAEHTEVIPEGVSLRFRPPPDTGIREPHRLLFVGRFDPYKNAPVLVEAFKKVVDEFSDARLEIIGPEDKRYPGARNRAEQLELQNHITWHGYVSDDELIKAYQRASIYVLPSKYEGFGLPVLEAMACGTPVVCGNHSSLPEVAGDAVEYADISHPERLAQAMLELLRNPERMEELSQAGLKRARQFSWRQTAERTIEAYGRAMRMNYEQ